MSRILLAAVAALALVPFAAPAMAATSLQVTAPGALYAANATSQAIPVKVTAALATGDCLGTGGTITVTLAATATGNASVTLSPETLTFNVGATDTATGPKTYPTQTATATVTAGLVRQTTNTTVAFTVTARTSCGPAAGSTVNGPPASTTVTFEQLSAFTPTATEEPVPGVGALALVAVVVLAAFVARRK